jgi:membrane protease YdiL (CAAX protease family)
MSMITASDLPHASPGPAPAVPSTQPRPWGFWATLGWALFALFSGPFSIISYYGLIWTLTHELRIPGANDAVFADVTGILCPVAVIVVLVIAIAIRKSSPRDYFGLHAASRRDVVLGVVCLSVLIAGLDALRSWLGGGASGYTVSVYEAAELAGVLPLLWIQMVIVGPVAEELLYRGFLYRGWAASWLGVVGTVILTSLMFALTHWFYSWVNIFGVFCHGVLYGWLRHRTGSTTLAIGLHAFYNLYVMVWIWLSP